MEEWFQVGAPDTVRLLSEWRWLCPSRMSLTARNVFGELFLRDEVGAVLWLNTTIGKFNKASSKEAEFREMAETSEKRKEWFAEPEALSYAKRGLNPGLSQCIGFSVPVVFAEGGMPETAYVADLYDYVSFLGDLHRQISDLPDGGKVQLRVNPPKPALPKRA
jgi:hypothetical protein